jgi:NAD(P)-dependent dehydrogenase (short-subunit alcohol dehydrogenase family)
MKADVGKEADVKAAIDKAVSEFGRMDIMVCRFMSSLNNSFHSDLPQFNNAGRSCRHPQLFALIFRIQELCIRRMIML